MATANPYATDLAGRDPIAAYSETPRKIRAVTANWSAAQFERSYAPGKWPARKILIHLAQTELALGTRARMAASTPNYAAQSFNQDEWLAKEHTLGGREAVDAFVAIASMNRAFFEGLSTVDRTSTLNHPEYGVLTVQWILEQLAGHQIHHLKQLEQVSRA